MTDKIRPPLLRESQMVFEVSTLFTGAPNLQGDAAVALDDERADGAVNVAGLDAATGKTWAGFIFRKMNDLIVVPDLAGDDEVPEPETELPEAPQAAQQPPEEDEEEREAEGEGNGEGDDELTRLIHAIAGGRDEVVLEELGIALRDHLEKQLDERVGAIGDQVDQALAAIAEKGLEVKTVIEVKGLPPVKLNDGEMAHKDLELVLALVQSGAKNVMLVGPAGCGKTTLARQVSRALSHDRFAALSCSPGMSEAKVLGRLGIPTEKNETGYHETAVMAAFRNGGTILFDEMDNADASMMVSFNAMTDGGFATLPTGETVPRHPDTVIIAACNTFGHGADRMYVGRNQLDAATLDRFVGATVEMDYDRALEKSLCPEEPIRDVVWSLRDKARKHGLRRVVSTRALTAARRRHLGMGESLPTVMKHLTLGWSDADRKAVGVA